MKTGIRATLIWYEPKAYFNNSFLIIGIEKNMKKKTLSLNSIKSDLDQIDRTFFGLVTRYSIPVLRFDLGVIFVWFGA